LIARYGVNYTNNLLPRVTDLVAGGSMRCSKIKFCLADLSIVDFYRADCDDIDHILIDPNNSATWDLFDCQVLEYNPNTGTHKVCCLTYRDISTWNNIYDGNPFYPIISPIQLGNYDRNKLCHTIYQKLPEDFYEKPAPILPITSVANPDQVSVIMNPNPVSDLLKMIAFSPNHNSFSLSLADITGKLFWSGEVVSGNETHVDVSRIPPGVIFVVIRSPKAGNIIHTSKIIKL
jgi:hypothetical protein